MADIYIETYGCQMNEYDSELVSGLLSREHHICQTPEQADVVLINTCAVRENAHHKIRSRLGNLKKLRDHKPVHFGILGCMAQNLKDELLSIPVVDFAIGPDAYRELPGMIDRALGKNPEGSTSAFELSEYETYTDIAPRRQAGVNAWIAIMRGCDNFCSFCVVPYTRGRERSRTLSSVVDEARGAVEAGYPQITLLGQNVNSYRSENNDFYDLMAAVSDIPGLKRVRFTSPHPKDFPKRLLQLIAERPNLCKQIHLPLQAGNSTVLKRMHRGYTRDEFEARATEIRAAIPGVQLSTDIIVGFPGETPDQFDETAAVMESVRFDASYIFKYSERQDTLAVKKYRDDVAPEEKTRRIVILNEMQRRHTIESLSRQVGQTQEILVESIVSHLSEQQCKGRNDAGIIVILPRRPEIKVGDMLDLEITGHTPHILLGDHAEKYVPN